MRILLAFTVLTLAGHLLAANEIDSKVEAALAAENGKLYVAIGTDRIKENVLTEPGFEHPQLM